MQTNDILTLYDYNYWATERLLRAAARLTQEQFLADGPMSFGGVRSTLAHTLGAEWIWRKRCQEGVSPTAIPAPTEYPDFATLQQRWLEEQSAMLAYVATLDDETLSKPLAYRGTNGDPFSVTLWQILAHVVNHGTQHRSEAAALLTNLGHSPGDIDMILFFRERKP
ncbi:MAG: hypothetical protein HC802_08080 [Caldilineaceae bacterium]|nr:hypothetical protein [Caldilineaceae bacterium]